MILPKHYDQSFVISNRVLQSMLMRIILFSPDNQDTMIASFVMNLNTTE